MKASKFFAAALGTAALLAAGCAPLPARRVPVALAEYRKSVPAGATDYPTQTIVLHNLQRVLDGDLAEPARLKSLELVTKLGQDEPAVRAQLAGVLGDDSAPSGVQEAVLTILLKTDHPDLARYVVRALPKVKHNRRLRDAILNWLILHPTPAVLAEVVKLWAEEPPAGPNEPRYRIVVEKVSGKEWDDALLEGINAKDFFARGSALEVLLRRFPPERLSRRIARLAPKTEAVAALQVFIERFDYVPRNGVEFLAAASAYKANPRLLAEAAELFRKWQKKCDYRFNIRDYHLLVHMAQDPMRKVLSRTQLVLEVGHALSSRQHVKAQGLGQSPYSDRFASQVDRLTVADLWNLYLLNEMLGNPRVQLALKIMADKDRADGTGAWGGLVFYRNGRAEAELYPVAPRAAGNDLIYSPSQQAIRDGRNALCRFHGHFEKMQNTKRAGPTTGELLDARRSNTYGLVLTSVTEYSFCAHYYSPDGVVISLGKFPFAPGR